MQYFLGIVTGLAILIAVDNYPALKRAITDDKQGRKHGK